jgi:hypothetical protein
MAYLNYHHFLIIATPLPVLRLIAEENGEMNCRELLSGNTLQRLQPQSAKQRVVRHQGAQRRMNGLKQVMASAGSNGNASNGNSNGGSYPMVRQSNNL